GASRGCDGAPPRRPAVLPARHYPGDGVIDFAHLARAVEETGYDGDIGVEIFNADIWNTPHPEVARRVVESFGTAVSPHLGRQGRSEEHTSELQSRFDLVCRLLLEKKKIYKTYYKLVFTIQATITLQQDMS